MSLTSYRRDLQARKRELAALLGQRQKIDQKIAQLQPLINHLEGLCRELGDRAAKDAATKVELTTGLTELMRATLTEAYVPVSASDLKSRMEAKGFDFSGYSNPLASIHVVLRRLIKAKQVKVVPQKAGRNTYQWITTLDHLLTLLQGVNKMAVAQQSRSQGTTAKLGAPEDAKQLRSGLPEKR